MSDEGADPVLNMLRAILATQDEHSRKLDEVITRLSARERDFAGMKMDFAGMRVRLDTLAGGSTASNVGLIWLTSAPLKSAETGAAPIPS